MPTNGLLLLPFGVPPFDAARIGHRRLPRGPFEIGLKIYCSRIIDPSVFINTLSALL
jgi:hypothetical protein